MDPHHPRADGPRRRRAFTPADKLAHLAAYEHARQEGAGGAYLRREGREPGAKIGRLTAEQAEIARLTRELARANKRLTTTEAALSIMGKAHAYAGDPCQ